jgi:hypothetical protein
MVRVVSVRPMGFFDLRCRYAVEVVVGGRDGCVVEVVGGDLISRWWWGLGVGLIMNMVERGFMSLLLLAKDIDSIL